MAESVNAHAPGRTELAGNHTDHQGGRVIAATLDCGIDMTVEPCSGNVARVESEGFAPLTIDISSDKPVEPERFSTPALVRGVVAGFRECGVPVEGFAVRAASTIPSGGGLSSSAAFELALASALTLLFGEENVPKGQSFWHILARIGQAAERDYFGKPCGLMDQLSIALGGVNVIDFAADEPAHEHVPFDFEACGHALVLVDTHCDHSRYTYDYAQVAVDMAAVAHSLGAQRLSQVPEEHFLERFDSIRAELGDLPALRGLHYYHEIALVDERARALRCGDFAAFLDATRRSGASSAQFLQNVSTFDRRDQPAMVALALCERFLAGLGACRIHGGGFGGTIQAFVPLDLVAGFTASVDAHLGAGSSHSYSISQEGARASWA